MIPGVWYTQANRRWRASLSGYGSNGYIGEYLTEAEATSARQAAELLVDGYLHDQSAIEIDGAFARVPLFGRRSVLVGWATINLIDLPLVEGRRWALSHSRYAVSRRRGGVEYLHRLIMPGAGVADHINGDTLDCRRANLRRCTQQENSRNRAGSRHNPTGLKGVTARPNGRFEARITVDRAEIYLGMHSTPEAAARAYDIAAIKHFGEFARLNFALEPQDIAA